MHLFKNTILKKRAKTLTKILNKNLPTFIAESGSSHKFKKLKYFDVYKAMACNFYLTEPLASCGGTKKKLVEKAIDRRIDSWARNNTKTLKSIDELIVFNIISSYGINSTGFTKKETVAQWEEYSKRIVKQLWDDENSWLKYSRTGYLELGSKTDAKDCLPAIDKENLIRGVYYTEPAKDMLYSAISLNGQFFNSGMGSLWAIGSCEPNSIKDALIRWGIEEGKIEIMNSDNANKIYSLPRYVISDVVCEILCVGIRSGLLGENNQTESEYSLKVDRWSCVVCDLVRDHFCNGGAVEELPECLTIRNFNFEVSKDVERKEDRAKAVANLLGCKLNGEGDIPESAMIQWDKQLSVALSLAKVIAHTLDISDESDAHTPLLQFQSDKHLILGGQELGLVAYMASRSMAYLYEPCLVSDKYGYANPSFYEQSKYPIEGIAVSPASRANLVRAINIFYDRGYEHDSVCIISDYTNCLTRVIGIDNIEHAVPENMLSRVFSAKGEDYEFFKMSHSCRYILL
ncbi:hypothetical protein DZF79_04380 [Vibrio parahaemolyticus]|nr:hypothetical protein [Vibrio parahaemolyticus]